MRDFAIGEGMENAAMALAGTVRSVGEIESGGVMREWVDRVM